MIPNQKRYFLPENTDWVGIRVEINEDIAVVERYLWYIINQGGFVNYEQAKAAVNAYRAISLARELIAKHLSQLPMEFADRLRPQKETK